MDLIAGLKAEFFQAPQRRRSTWFVVGFGFVSMAFGLAGERLAAAFGPFFNVPRGFVLLGFGFLLVGTADVLPDDRRLTAGVLRIAGVVSWGLYAIVIVFLFL